MSALRTHFEERAASLSDRAVIDSGEKGSAVMLRLRPNESTAVGVVFYLYAETYGTVALADPGCVPAELGDNPDADLKAVDYFIDAAVEGRATAFPSRPGRMRRDPGGRQNAAELAQCSALAGLETSCRVDQVWALHMTSKQP